MGEVGTAAVVGAAGFLGSALVAAAERSGVPVAAYTRATPFLSSDGSPDGLLARSRTVFWLASSINPALAESDPARVRTDREAFASLLGAVRTLPEPPRVVLLSSGGTVYDPAHPPPYRESSPTRPRGAYGRAKLELEALLTSSALPGVIVRASNVYGPGQPAVSGQGVVGYWLRAAARGDDLVVYGEPETTRDYVYVEDVAAALLAVHRAAAVPPLLNIGSGDPTSLKELADTVLDVVGDPALRWDQRPARGFDVPHTWLDVTLARTAIGWRPATVLRDGLAAAWHSVGSGSPQPAPEGSP
jgi:UDP-glucose 4-epimerase